MHQGRGVICRRTESSACGGGKACHTRSILKPSCSTYSAPVPLAEEALHARLLCRCSQVLLQDSLPEGSKRQEQVKNSRETRSSDDVAGRHRSA